jgi:hypothetical protein
MAERQPRVPRPEQVVVEEEKALLDPRAERNFQYLTNRFDYSGMSYDDIMVTDENLDGMRTVERKRGRHNTQNTLYLSELLVGSKYTDSEFFNDVVDQVRNLPADMKPDEIVTSGWYLGSYEGKNKEAWRMMKPGLRSLDNQFRRGKEQFTKLRELGIPIVYARSDNDTEIIDEMTYTAFDEMFELAKAHVMQHEESVAVKRQFSRRQKWKANPNWPEYYRFTKYVAFPYCIRSGRMLRTAEQLTEQTGVEHQVPERELLFDAYRRLSNGQRLLAEHLAVLDKGALRDSADLTIVGDFEHVVTTRGSTYTDLVRHKLQTSSVLLGNYFKNPKRIRGYAESEGALDNYDNMVLTGSHEAAGVMHPDNKATHSIGSLQDPKRALKEDGDILTSSANTIARQIFGRGRYHNASATSIARTDDGRQIMTFYENKLREVAESIPERTAIMSVCDEQIGSLSSRVDYLLKQLDRVSETLKVQKVVLNFGGDRLHGRNYSDFPRESGRTGLMGMDQQDDLSITILNMWLDSLTKQQYDNLTVNVTTGNHEWNSGTLKWHGYSFAAPVYHAFVSGYMNKGYSREEAETRVNFHDTIETDKGEPFKTFSTIMHLGAFGIEMRHLIGKGGGTGGLPPALMSQKNAVDLGGIKKDIHLVMIEHYHHPSYVLSNGMLHVGSGSIAGLTGFEYDFGLRPVISTSTVQVGEGKPTQLEFVTEETLIKHKIKDGPFSDKVIADTYRLRTDPGHDPYRHGLYTAGETPKSAVQKFSLELGKRAAYSDRRTGYLSPR